jgi:SHAQKYF class myb-like DNA-binding protein
MINMPLGGNGDRELERRVTDDSGDDSQKQQRCNRMDRNKNSNAGAAMNSESVVPDLMQVYDALTQSSTPQPGGVHPPLSTGGAAEHVNYYPNTGGHQVILPPALPHVSIATRQSSQQRSRSLKSGGSSDESYSDTSGSKRKSPTEFAKPSRRIKKGKQEDSKKKSAPTDSRWSKRFTWPDELHRDFVAAVFEVGLKHSSPSAIMEHMKQNPDVTSERVKSHLQKYRLNRQKSRNEFMTSYDRALDGFQNNPHDFDDGGDHSFSCGEVAALLTHSIQVEGNEGSQSSKGSNRGAEQPPTQGQSGPSPQDSDGVATIHLPLLSEEESRSPLGQTFGYLVGMFHTLSMELEMKRRPYEVDQDQSNALSPGPIGQVQYHSTHQHPYHQSIEETAATAASINVTDPSIYEQVANVIPHAVATKGSSDGPAIHMFPPVGGMYRVQSHGVRHDQRQMAGAASQVGYSQHQGSQPADLPQERHDAAHTYHHHAPRQPVTAPTHHSSTGSKPSLVPCPLDSTGSPSNASGHGTGRTLQAQKESSIMKQDMKSQKVFQNKMRALKQVELNKYSGRENPTSQLMQSQEYTHESLYQSRDSGCDETNQSANEQNISHSPLQHDEGFDHDFWNSGDVNDQLFNFLMDDS